MKATVLYRIAAVVFVLFAVGHTYGFLSLRAPTVEGRAVFDAMNTVHFVVSGHSYSYGGFYRGFGMTCTVSMLLSAFLAWHLGELARSAPSAIGVLGWALFAAQLAGVAICLKYFGPPQVVFSGVAALLAGWAAWMARG
ncbi:MAG: LIC_13387 family protein [Candidatus Acidiferrum sp.]